MPNFIATLLERALERLDSEGRAELAAELLNSTGLATDAWYVFWDNLDGNTRINLMDEVVRIMDEDQDEDDDMVSELLPDDDL